MRKVDTSVGDLVGMIERGELRLPEMQRRYVWRAPRVRDLLDSLYRGYPTGTVLVWETDQQMPTRDLAIAQQASPFAGHKLLLDGQQRLTSLSAILRGEPITVRGRRRPIEILFNLEHPEGLGEFTEVTSDEESPLNGEDDADQMEDDIEVAEGPQGIQQMLSQRTFVVASKNLSRMANWVNVSKVFKAESDTEILKEAGVRSFEEPNFAKYTARLQRLRKIRDYPYVMQLLERGLDYEEVAEIFVRVNSLGVKLRGSDLALALITSRWQNSLHLLEEFQSECEDKWFTLDLGLLVRAMVVFASRQSRFKTVGSIPIDRLKSGWEQAKEGLRFSINFLRSNAQIEDESLLSSPFLVIPIAVLSQLRSCKLSREEERDILHWLHIANARGRYSRGSSETLLDEDLAALFRGSTPKDLIGTVRQQFGRLTLEPSEFEGRGARSPLFSLVFLALRAAGAKDWQSGLGISLTHQGKLHFIQYHHIFPKSLLKDKYEKSEINEIANMAFISGDTNRRLGNKEPSTYFPQILKERGEEALLSQAVPVQPALHSIAQFRDFLKIRRQLLCELVNRHIERASAA